MTECVYEEVDETDAYCKHSRYRTREFKKGYRTELRYNDLSPGFEAHKGRRRGGGALAKYSLGLSTRPVCLFILFTGHKYARSEIEVKHGTIVRVMAQA